jgi:cystathionine beta-lyase
MSFDFDKIIDRRNTCSLKYDCAAERGRPGGLLPMWVADMDFCVPAEISAALTATAERGIFGYAVPSPDYFGILGEWLETHYGWRAEREWLVNTPGVVFALATAVKAFTRADEAVLIQQPVYYPFKSSVLDNGRKLINSPLVQRGGRYETDLCDFEKKIVENDVKLFILCNPHNPVGRVWTAAEVAAMAEICLRHGVTAVSDEIHADFVYGGNRHSAWLALGQKYRGNVIVCTSPGKSFNMAGLQFSDIFIPDAELRKKFTAEIDKTGYSQLNTFGIAAARAAYLHGAPWLAALVKYLDGNAGFIREYLEKNIPKIKYTRPEGTYLAWLDFRAYGLTPKELDRLMTEKAGLWLDGGTIFGAEGAGFQRVNFACPRSVLAQALAQIKEAVDSL